MAGKPTPPQDWSNMPTFDQLMRELEDAKAENARLIALLRECRNVLAKLLDMADDRRNANIERR